MYEIASRIAAEHEEEDARQQDMEMQQNGSYENCTTTLSPSITTKSSSRCFTVSVIAWCVLLTLLVVAALILSARSLSVSSESGSCQCSLVKEEVSTLFDIIG